jgi:hypothetical protein
MGRPGVAGHAAAKPGCFARSVHGRGDLRRAADDRWFCFEVNPAPGFSFFELDDEQTMVDAAARLLANT